jgi:hypothetical protein
VEAVLTYNLDTRRYEAEIDGRLLCVDEEGWNKRLDEETQDPRDDEYNVVSVLLHVDQWMPRVGIPHVYYADQAKHFHHHLVLASPEVKTTVLQSLTNDPVWGEITEVSFLPDSDPLGQRRMRWILTLQSSSPVSPEYVQELQPSVSILGGTFNLPRF